MIKTKEDRDFTDTVKSSYKIVSKLGYSARITDIWRMLSMVFGVSEFEILNLRSPNIGEFESYLLNNLIEWKRGNPVDFEELEKSILTFGDFTEREKLLFSTGNMQERLWAIFLCLVDPNINLN